MNPLPLQAAHGPLPLRRALLAAGLALPFGLARPARAATADRRILVVFEMSGGNDGLNTVVPLADDTYYRLRPNLGIRPERLRKLDDRHGLNPGMAGFERLYKDGRLAITHGCGYEQPSCSHFASMAYWHTAAPNSGEETGWVGRLGRRLAAGWRHRHRGRHRSVAVAGGAQPPARAGGVR